MSDSETFDAFYARTAWSVTSRMHSMTGQDSEADHAVREAYARAYQQWYEVSGYRDPEDWVLKVAEEAYERRRARATVAGLTPDATGTTDSSTWPGIYRPRSPRTLGTAGHDPGAQVGSAQEPPDIGGKGSRALAHGGIARSGMADAGTPQGGMALGGTADAAMASSATAGPGVAGPGMAGPGMGASGIGGGGAVDPERDDDQMAGLGLTSAAVDTRGADPLAGRTATGSEPTDSTWLGGARMPDTSARGPVAGTTTSIGPGRGRTRWPGRGGSRSLANRRNQAGLGSSAGPGGWAGPDSSGQRVPGGTSDQNPTPPTRSSPSRPGRLASPHRGSGQSRLGFPADLANRRMLAAGVAAVIGVAVVAYLAFGAFGGQHSAKPPPRGPGTAGKAKPAVHMLAAGRTGRRASVPWSIVGPGWTLAEFSAAPPDGSGSAAQPGALSLYMVDPEGGKYLMRTWSGAAITLLAWSGDARHALVRVASSAGPQPPAFGVLTLATGQVTNLPVKAGVTPVSFTRPHGLNILAVRRTATRYQLRRYGLNGVYQATLSTMPDRQPVAASQASPCASQCNALSSPDGLTAVWGIAGNEMQLVNNAGGLIRRLHVPSSGTPPSCLPVSWWDADTVLANCAAPGQPNANSERLWLVPANGAAPTALAPASGSASGTGFEAGAWSAGGHIYLTQTSARQCSTAATGPGGLGIMAVGQGGSVTPVTVARSTNYYDNVVAAVGSRLIVLAQTSCPGTSSLLWFTPSDGTTTALLPAPAGELGVLAAVPYRGAPTAYALG
ncbi:MAG: RNA polymerase sigma factor [Streptosporangiaceae bacterium]